jgi:hypothetical protein
MSDQSDDPPFRLESPPDELWSKARLAREFGITEREVDERVRTGRIPGPWTRRRRRPLWAPEIVAPALDRHRRLAPRAGE